MFKNKQTNDYIKTDKQKISCPPKNLNIWQKHPTIYIKLNEDTITDCPYCGTKYKFTKKN